MCTQRRYTLCYTVDRHPRAVGPETERLLMGTAEVRIPLPPNLSGDEVRTLAAVKLFEVGRVSLGQAAEMSGHSVRSFVDVLARYDVPVINYPEGDLDREIQS